MSSSVDSWSASKESASAAWEGSPPSPSSLRPLLPLSQVPASNLDPAMLATASTSLDAISCTSLLSFFSSSLAPPPTTNWWRTESPSMTEGGEREEQSLSSSLKQDHDSP